MDKGRLISSIVCLACGILMMVLGSSIQLCIVVLSPSLPCEMTANIGVAGLAFTVIGGTLLIVTIGIARREKSFNDTQKQPITV